MTIDSPVVAGSRETRMSIGRWSRRMLMRPSCGLRCSAMSMRAITLRRVMTGPASSRSRELAS